MNANPYPGDSLEQLQDAERDIIKIVDKICRENAIDYFIDGGTCLGAVRHGGFIPWDDDIDIGMPKPDYDRFCAIAPQLLPCGYSLHTSADTEGFSALWAKVFKDGTRFIDEVSQDAGCDQGIFVDIFPYYQLDVDPEKAKAQCKKARMAQVKSYLKHLPQPKLPKDAPAKPVLKAACRMIHNTVAKLWSQASLQAELDHAFDTREPAEIWTNAAYSNLGAFETDMLFPTKDIDFDGVTLRAPNDCEAFLTKLYGDYMQLPPDSERYTHAPVVLEFEDGINVMQDPA